MSTKYGGKKMKYSDIEKEATYFDIIIGLLEKPYEIRSLLKLTFLAFTVNVAEYKVDKHVKTLDLTSKFMSNLKIELFNSPDDFKTIFKIIKMLEKTGCICVEQNEITYLKPLSNYNCKNKVLSLSSVCKAILEINTITDKSFVEEVIRNV